MITSANHPSSDEHEEKVWQAECDGGWEGPWVESQTEAQMQADLHWTGKHKAEDDYKS